MDIFWVVLNHIGFNAYNLCIYLSFFKHIGLPSVITRSKCIFLC